MQSNETVPKTLSPRIRNNQSREDTGRKRRPTEEESPVQARFMINQKSSSSNFHEAEYVGVSEEQLLERRMLESNSNEEPDFA